MARWVASWFSLRRLADVIGQLGQRLGRTEADASWDAGPLQHTLMNLMADGHKVSRDALEVEEGLVEALSQ